MSQSKPHIAIIGAGIGGLSAALRLQAAGAQTTVFEAHAAPGGKMRTLPSPAGPVDAGPTVLTMKPVFDALFAAASERLEDHVTLIKAPILARHFWRDGTVLDLFSDHAASLEAIARTLGPRAAHDFERFSGQAEALFHAFDTPMMQSAHPSQLDLAGQVLKNPALISAMAPHRSLAAHLRRRFESDKLIQLFARYATYVGGTPAQSPALLGLIWAAEKRGVWHVKGGMHKLARAIEALAQSLGAAFFYDTPAEHIEIKPAGGLALHTEGAVRTFDAVVFNGDPRALQQGLLGRETAKAVPRTAVEPRSLSACVYAFAAKPLGGVPLVGHNVFFADDPDSEYLPLARGGMQDDPTLYVCAQDRFGRTKTDGPERFEIILNAPPIGNRSLENEALKCPQTIFDRLSAFGLSFDPPPSMSNLTTPSTFAEMFPASMGSLYGRSPHGLTAGLKRPTARTSIPGLYLVGGGAHPGAGVPMATLSARHAAEAITHDLGLTSTSPEPATLGGMSTA